MNPLLILTCEHASAEVPTDFQDLFLGYSSLLNTHRALDIGALSLWNSFKEKGADWISLAIKGEYTRLLIDLNRSEKHPYLFSEIIKPLSKHSKKKIIQDYYYPYRQKVIALINERDIPVIHLSVHTFTASLHNKVRNTDIGLLYDPTRLSEKNLAYLWAKKIKSQTPQYRVRMNYPYRGRSDGFTSFLRRDYLPEKYLGLELEVNQKYFVEESAVAQSFLQMLPSTFFSAIELCTQG
jgi:predicted N-formylglutamate amidohydrolase